mgnify:CR=1 FL=1
MATEVKCPKCGSSVDVESVIAHDLGDKLKKEYEAKLRDSLVNLQSEKDRLLEEQRSFEEKKKKENELFAQKLAQEKARLESEIKEQVQRSIASDFEVKLKIAEEANREKEEKLKIARQKELEFLQKEQQLKNREAELDIQVQKILQQERVGIEEQIRKQEHEKNHLKLRELEIQLDAQKKLADEMKRKAEQGSQQLQGEAQELFLEEILRTNFPFDRVTEVSKGVEGADCVLVINTPREAEVGKIIFESKRAKGWSNLWIEKLKKDMRAQNAELAILVSQIYPKGMECFGEKDGVWICNAKEVVALTHALRNAIIRIAETKKFHENTGEKMQMLYSYLTGTEFRQQMETIVEGFMSLRSSIVKERVQMEKIWKEREKQIEKVLLSTSGMYGSVKGIAGAAIEDIPQLTLGDSEE